MMIKEWRYKGLLVLLFLLTVPAYGDNVADEAELEFQLGMGNYKKKAYQEALLHFLSSHRLVANRNVVFNIARTYEELKQAPQAYRYYIDALEKETRESQKREIQEGLARLASQVAVLNVVTKPPGAIVYLERRDLGSRGNAPRNLGLNGGKYKVILELSGYEVVEKDVTLQIGQTLKLEEELVPINGKVAIEGTKGSNVRLDAEGSPVLCIVPCKVDVIPGHHMILVSKEGYQSLMIPVEIAARKVMQLSAVLLSEVGTLSVNTDIRGAVVSVDDKVAGFTPLSLQLPVGSHAVHVALSGYRPVDRMVKVKQEEQEKVIVEMELAEEVTAASRVEESIEMAPASVTILTSQELRAMGYPTIAEALRGVRGMYLSYDTSYDALGVRGASILGSYGNRILVLIDGHPTNDNYIWSSYVGYDGLVDLEDVDRIEVIRGPGSVLYGTSAFLGMINVITRSKNQATHAEGHLSVGGNGIGRGKMTGYWRISENAGMWTSVSGAHGKGRDYYFEELNQLGSTTPARDYYGRPYNGWARDVDELNAAMVQGRLWWKDLTLQWFVNTRKKAFPSTVFNTVLNSPDTTFQDTRGFAEMRFEPTLSKTLKLFARAYFDFYSFDGSFGRRSWYQPGWSQSMDGGGTEKDTYRGKWGGVEARLQYAPSAAFRLIMGGEVIRHFQVMQGGQDEFSPVIFNTAGTPIRSQPFSSFAAYVNMDTNFTKSIRLSIGGRFDYFDFVPTSQFFDWFNPRLALIIKPYQKGTLKVLLGKAFRAPSVFERFPPLLGFSENSKLTPEQIYSGEIELSHRFSPSWTLTMAGFVNGITNLIEQENVIDGNETKLQYKNSQYPLLIVGGEAELRREWRQGWMISLIASVNFSTYFSKTFIDNMDAADCAKLNGIIHNINQCYASALRAVPNSPLVLASLKGAMPIMGRSWMLMSRLTLEGSRPGKDSSTAIAELNPQDPERPNVRIENQPQGSTNLGLVWDLVFSGDIERYRLHYAIGVYNMMDWKYSIPPSNEFLQKSILQNGRTYLASLTASF